MRRFEAVVLAAVIGLVMLDMEARAGGESAHAASSSRAPDEAGSSAPPQECEVRSAWVIRGGAFVGHVRGAPAFANAAFAALVPNGLSEGAEVVVSCNEPQPGAASGSDYTVQAGDTLTSIASRFGTSIAALLAANGIANPDHLSIGQHLTIPGGMSAGDTPTSSGVRRIGSSAKGRPIEVTCHGAGPRTALFVGGMHTGPYEEVSSEVALEIAALVEHGRLPVPSGVQICIVPTMNPDGIALGTRTNANGVDLNRNWPGGTWRAEAFHPEDGPVSGGSAPLSEPETRALYDYMVETRPDVVVAWHCCGALVEESRTPPASSFAAAYAQAAGFAHIDDWHFYPVTGQLFDATEQLGIPALDIEMERSDATGLAQHRAGVVAVLDRLAATGG